MAGDVRTGSADSSGGEFSGGVVEVELAQGLGQEARTHGIRAKGHIDSRRRTYI